MSRDAARATATRRLLSWVVASALACSAGAISCADEPTTVDRMEPTPKQLEGVDLVDRPDAQLPLDLSFLDEAGKPVTLRDYFKPGRPVILTLNYFRCPMLCTLVLNGATTAMKEVAFRPGADYEIVTVSIDQRDTPELAAQKKANYVGLLGKPEGAAAWHFLVGSPEHVKQLADSVGFSYKFDQETGQYAHPAAIFVATPEGHLSRALKGVQFDPQTLRLSLAEAAAGRIGSTLDAILLFCFHYDSDTGKYTMAAINLVRLASVLTILVLGFFLAHFWRRERRRILSQALAGTHR